MKINKNGNKGLRSDSCSPKTTKGMRTTQGPGDHNRVPVTKGPTDHEGALRTTRGPQGPKLGPGDHNRARKS